MVTCDGRVKTNGNPIVSDAAKRFEFVSVPRHQWTHLYDGERLTDSHSKGQAHTLYPYSLNFRKDLGTAH